MMRIKNKRKNRKLVIFFLFSLILFLATTVLYSFIKPNIENMLSLNYYIRMSAYFFLGSAALFVFYHRASKKEKNKLHTIIGFFHPFLFLFFVIFILLSFSEKEIRKTVLLTGFITYVLYRVVFLVFASGTNKKE